MSSLLFQHMLRGICCERLLLQHMLRSVLSQGVVSGMR